MYKQNTFIIYKLYSKVSPDGQLCKMETPPTKMDMRVGPFLLYTPCSLLSVRHVPL